MCGTCHGSAADLVHPRRAVEFLIALLLRLCTDPDVTLSAAASEVYTATLYKYHTWYTAAAFTVALKVCMHARTRTAQLVPAC